MLPKITTWLKMVHGMSIASLLPVALCAELGPVLWKCVFIPCWVQIDPVSLFFLVNVRILEELCMVKIGNE